MKETNQFDTPLKRVSVQGAVQFNQQRLDMLAAYDNAKVYMSGHEYPAHHGNVAEACFRQWLTSFLPKKYGVTSGYIISLAKTNQHKLSHYDVIIYNAAESPVLWTEENPDKSDLGKARAIPAEYVYAVIEVKSVLDRRSARQSVGKLSTLRHLIGVNDPDLAYRRYMFETFAAYSVFFELKEEGAKQPEALSGLLPDIPFPAYWNALVLRGVGKASEISASLDRLRFPVDSPTSPATVRGNHTILNQESFWSEAKVCQDDLTSHEIVTGLWSELAFSGFIRKLLGRFEGEHGGGIWAYGMSWNDGRPEPVFPFLNVPKKMPWEK